MLVLLPPSETKRPGGDGAPLKLESLALGELAHVRRTVCDALVALSADRDEAARVLKLSPRQLSAIDDNAALYSSATMPAMDRYTGVLFDALDATTLAPSARGWLGETVLIHSAPFGPVSAADMVPSYRLAAAARLPQLASLKSLWVSAVSAAIDAHEPAFVLDLRSEAYVALGPIGRAPSVFVRVVSRTATGATRALNHFNKLAKGQLVRRLAESHARIDSADDLLAWAAEHDFEFIRGEREWQLAVES